MVRIGLLGIDMCGFVAIMIVTGVVFAYNCRLPVILVLLLVVYVRGNLECLVVPCYLSDLQLAIIVIALLCIFIMLVCFLLILVINYR